MLKPLLFSPGPVVVEESVRQALLHYDVCHRGKEFETMLDDTRKKICRLMGADDSFDAVIVSGSGTSANECVLSSVLKECEEILLITNGMFGERLEEIIVKYKIPMVKLDFGWAKLPDINMIEKEIAAHPGIKMVAMVFHETSTSMINPVFEVGQLCKKYGKMFFVDSVSAAGGQYVDMIKNNIDISTSVGGKCVGAFPGSAFVCARVSLLERLTPDQCHNVYLSLYKHYMIAKKMSQTPNTPNLTLFWALNKAITNILERGLDKQIERYRKHAHIIREGLRRLDLKTMIPEDQMSNTVTSVFLPEGVELAQFIDGMESDGFILYPGKGAFFEQGMFQIANMGALTEEDCRHLMACIERRLGADDSRRIENDEKAV